MLFEEASVVQSWSGALNGRRRSSSRLGVELECDRGWEFPASSSPTAAGVGVGLPAATEGVDGRW